MEGGKRESVFQNTAKYTLKAVFPLLNKPLKPGDEKDQLIHYWSFFLPVLQIKKL